MVAGANGLRFHVLGPLTVFDGAARLDLGPARERAVLAMLLVSANEVVSVDRLVDQLWTEPPAGAVGTLHTYISHLRRSLEPDRASRTPPRVLVSEAPGYALHVERSALDVLVFEDRLADARLQAEQGDWHAGLEALEAALACWTGVPLADFEHHDFTQAWRARLEERRAAAEELRIDALMHVGRDLDAIADLEALVDRWPLRERFRSQQVLTLARAGRQADALRAYDRARADLLDELGIDPGPDLEGAYRRVLEQDDALFASAPKPLAARRVPESARDHSRGFVGREGLVTEILELPRTSFVVISGEPGIGKTRLAEEVMSAARREGASVAFGRCHDDDGAPPMWPWRQVLRELGIDDGGASELSDMTDLFSQFEHVRRNLVEASRVQPIVFVLDDVQWADLTSLRLLAFLATELRSGDLLIMVTIRDTDVAPDSPVADALVRLARASAVRIELTGLRAEDVRDLLAHVAGLEVDEETVAALTERTGGNPFYVSEIARFWVSAGASDELPTAVGDVVRARVGRLSERSQTALTMAAVLGREFEVELLAHAIGSDGETVSDSLADALSARLVLAQPRGRMRFAHALVADALLAEAGPARVGRLHLHAAATMRQVRAEEGGPLVSAAEVARQLDRAAQLLGDAHAAEAGQAAIEAAVEASEAGGYIDEARWWERALAHGRRTSIAVEDEVHLLTELAIARLYAGLRLGPGSSSEARRQAIDLARTLPPPERGRALAEAGTVAFYRVHTWQWRPPGTRETAVVAALETALDELGTDDPERRVRVLASLAVEILSTPEGPDRAAVLAEQAVDLARSMGDTALLAQALLVLLLVLDVPGGRARQLVVIDEVLALRGHGLDKAETVAAMMWSIGCRVATGEGTVATAPFLPEVLALAADLHDPVMQLTGDWGGVGFAFFRAEMDRAQRRALAAYRRHVELGRWGSALLLVSHEAFRLREIGELPERPELIVPPGAHPEELRRLDGHALLWAAWLGDVGEAGLLVEHHAPRVLDWRGSAWMMWMSYLVEAATVGAPSWLERLYDELAPFAGEVILRGPHPPHGAVDHYLGLAAAGLGRHDVAAEHFADAVAIHDRVGALPWRWRSEVERAGQLDAAGDVGAAEASRAEARPELDRLGLVDLLGRIRKRSPA